MKFIVSAIVKYVKETDKLLYLLCISLSFLSILLIKGIINSELLPNSRTLDTQIAATLLGVAAAIIISKFDYRMLAGLWKLHVPLAYCLVFLTFVIGTNRGEADDKAWIILRLGSSFSVGFQPSEILKISFVLSFALHLEKVHDELNALKNVVLLGIHGMIPVLLIHFQGDDGTALVFAFVFFMMIFAAGLSWKYIIAALAVVAAAVPILWNVIMSSDQKLRVLAILHPDEYTQGTGWQQFQGRISIGSGQIWGTGIFSGNHRSSVPEIYNDFMFAFIGESLGFVGTCAVLLVIASVCVKIILNARMAADYLGKYICIGIFAILASQTFINIGMCLSVLPVIGITLPFLSAGGTSITTLYCGIGLVMSVYMHNKTTLFYE